MDQKQDVALLLPENPNEEHSKKLETTQSKTSHIAPQSYSEPLPQKQLITKLLEIIFQSCFLVGAVWILVPSLCFQLSLIYPIINFFLNWFTDSFAIVFVTVYALCSDFSDLYLLPYSIREGYDLFKEISPLDAIKRMKELVDTSGPLLNQATFDGTWFTLLCAIAYCFLVMPSKMKHWMNGGEEPVVVFYMKKGYGFIAGKMDALLKRKPNTALFDTFEQFLAMMAILIFLHVSFAIIYPKAPAISVIFHAFILPKLASEVPFIPAKHSSTTFFLYYAFLRCMYLLTDFPKASAHVNDPFLHHYHAYKWILYCTPVILTLVISMRRFVFKAA